MGKLYQKIIRNVSDLGNVLLGPSSAEKATQGMREGLEQVGKSLVEQLAERGQELYIAITFLPEQRRLEERGATPEEIQKALITHAVRTSYEDDQIREAQGLHIVERRYST